MSEFNPEVKYMRNELKELNVDVVESRGGKVYEVQKGDTLWDITKKQFGITDDTEIENKIINISKVNIMNDTIQEDSLSVIDGKLLSQPDGIPGDLIFAGEKIIIEIKDKGLSNKIKEQEILEEIPTTTQFLTDLEISNGEMYNKLVDKYNDWKEKFPEDEKSKSIENFLEGEIQPLFYSKIQDNRGSINHNGLLESVNYDTNNNYALTSEGKVVEYSKMGGGKTNFEDGHFLGYGIFWKHENL